MIIVVISWVEPSASAAIWLPNAGAQRLADTESHADGDADN